MNNFSYKQKTKQGYKAMRSDIKRRIAHYQNTGQDVRVSSMSKEDYHEWKELLYPSEKMDRSIIKNIKKWNS